MEIICHTKGIRQNAQKNFTLVVEINWLYMNAPIKFENKSQNDLPDKSNNFMPEQNPMLFKRIQHNPAKNNTNSLRRT